MDRSNVPKEKLMCALFDSCNNFQCDHEHSVCSKAYKLVRGGGGGGGGKATILF